MGACADRWPFRETLVAHPYGLRTVGRQSVSTSGGEAILGCGLSYLLTLHGVRLLSERVICREQNETNYKGVSRHGGSGAGLLGRYRVIVNLQPDIWLPAERAGLRKTPSHGETGREVTGLFVETRAP
jgi:hypothetical protein